MKRTLTALAMVLLIGVVAAHAGTVVLTFEGLQDNEEVLNYYNGGFGGNGSGPGPNYGITFGSDSLALISGADGGSGNFSGAPSGDTIIYFLSGAGDVMDVAAGFDTGFSFYYTAINNPGSVQVYSGLDGTGTLLADLYLPVTPSGGSPECTYGAFCPFEPIGVTFGGTAESVIFTGAANQIGFDNITLGSGTPVGSPEPGALTMLGTGLVGMLGLLRRKLNK